MSRRVSPPVEEFPKLRQPLTAGERTVFEMFDRHLPVEWEIYVQPHMNGLRPDFVLLNPKVGIGVFEIKDWDLDAMRYSVEKDDDGMPALVARRDGKRFSLQRENPVLKVNLYKDSIYKLYCPRLEQNDGFAAITAGVIFPYADTRRVKGLMRYFLSNEEAEEYAKYHPISGMTEVRSSNVRAVFPEAFRSRSRLMTEALAEDLRGWLVEPDFAKIQREPLILDPNQKNLVATWPASGYRRIKGPAGSGKSVVLAARAAHRADQGKSVLIVTFNITLWHYLRDLVVRGLKESQSINLIQFDHFHSFCRRVCDDAGFTNRYQHICSKYASDKNHLLRVAIPRLAEEALETGEVEKFDTIMVDEGQDYEPRWWNILRKALKKEGGEMLLVADATQDVYGTGKAWTEEAMHNLGFRSGPWAQLKTSYRLPAIAKSYARDFARRFLPPLTADLPDEEQADLALENCRLRWVQCPEEEGVEACVRELLLLMRQTGTKALANADITYLTDDTKLGEEVISTLSNRNIRTVSTFNQSVMERRREKMGFYMGDARIKATTLHSFKGWEARLLVVYVSEFRTEESKALIYAALTRLKRSPDGSWLTVVCAAPELAEFGRTWPDHHERGHGVVLFHTVAE
ncbi:UvrD-helicase domain-containing protein [Belnapia sp. T6]|uniref:DNA 3'-5' helicase II n=1 Tax=Belnapia mucosa TaxID=2804532 RepID=A0ABS1V9H4_9PROT|nr:UvrD-helicase domain-containing protein [Belnapia mucosa]MBL6458336.1 UvrD-helicase domain-containing protein [Belnapia mucosa]